MSLRRRGFNIAYWKLRRLLATRAADGYNAPMFDRSRVNEYRDQIARDLSELIKIPSVKGDTSPDNRAPFGAEPLRALQFVLDRGEALGFTAKNVDGYAGHVEYGKRGPLIGILVHLDVVPAGDGWKHEPFGGEIEDSIIYGRGAADNKGPAITALYVLRAFADQVPDPDVRFRIIFGTNEESGMEGVKYYLDHEETPVYGFSPDSGYPLYNREMGIVNAHLHADRTGRKIVSSFSGGEALNMVANQASALIEPEYSERARAFMEQIKSKGFVEDRLELEETNEGLLLKAKGISAHGGRPANGVSAIAYAVDAVAELARTLEAEKTEASAAEAPSSASAAAAAIEPEIQALTRLIGFETRGDSLGIACRDTESGELSANWGTIEVDERSVKTGINIRYPVTMEFDDISKALSFRASRDGFSVRFEHHLEPLFIPEDNPFIQRLLHSYETVTGEKAKPMSMSGGTYARMIKDRCVAFGAGFPGEANNVHQPDEHVSLDSLMRHAEISIQALYELSEASSELR